MGGDLRWRFACSKRRAKINLQLIGGFARFRKGHGRNNRSASDIEFQKKTNKWLVSERDFMFESLSSIPEIEVFSSETNFILFRIRDNSLFLDQHLYQHLLSQSLLIRNCGNFKSLDKSFFRISLRERLDNLKIADSINEFFSLRQRDFKKWVWPCKSLLPSSLTY